MNSDRSLCGFRFFIPVLICTTGSYSPMLDVPAFSSSCLDKLDDDDDDEEEEEEDEEDEDAEEIADSERVRPVTCSC